MKQNSVLRKSAKAALSGHWASAVLFVLVVGVLYFLVRLPYYVEQSLAETYTGHFSRTSVVLVLLLISVVLALLFIPMRWSFEVAFLSRLRGKNAFSLRLLGTGYADFGRVFSTVFWVELYAACWSLLFLVPGIVKYYSYAMASYILFDDKEICAEDAIDKSMEMMEGHKWQLFKLDVPFILLFLLGVLTLGIAWLWILPWWSTARAAFYEELRLENEAQLAAATEDIQ
ncbi:MAG: DUF975 family protein [Paludibacteraceae bacterium]